MFVRCIVLNRGVKMAVCSVCPLVRSALCLSAEVDETDIKLTCDDTRHEAFTRLTKKLDVLDLARMVAHKDIK